MTQPPKDLPWVHENTTNLILHEDLICNLCSDHLSHYRETGMGLSFLAACRAAEGEIRTALWSTHEGLDELWRGSEAITKDLNQENTEATRELKAIKQETDEVSQEIEKLSQELGEVCREARPVVSLVALLHGTSLAHLTMEGCRPRANTACTIRGNDQLRH